MLMFLFFSQDDELDISPVEIDDALVIEDDDISDDDEDDRDDVCFSPQLYSAFVMLVCRYFASWFFQELHFSFSIKRKRTFKNLILDGKICTLMFARSFSSILYSQNFIQCFIYHVLCLGGMLYLVIA